MFFDEKCRKWKTIYLDKCYFIQSIVETKYIFFLELRHFLKTHVHHPRLKDHSIHCPKVHNEMLNKSKYDFLAKDNLVNGSDFYT